MTDKQMVDILKGFAECDSIKNCNRCVNKDGVCGDGVAEIVFYRECARRLEELSAQASGQALSMNEYQHLAARTINGKLTDEQKLRHALHEIASEVGEIHGLYQKELQGHSFNRDELKKEIGDLLWGIAELCTAYGWSLENVARLNVEKLKKRYPEGFSAERSVHRED